MKTKIDINLRGIAFRNQFDVNYDRIHQVEIDINKDIYDKYPESKQSLTKDKLDSYKIKFLYQSEYFTKNKIQELFDLFEQYDLLDFQSDLMYYACTFGIENSNIKETVDSYMTLSDRLDKKRKNEIDIIKAMILYIEEEKDIIIEVKSKKHNHGAIIEDKKMLEDFALLLWKHFQENDELAKTGHQKESIMDWLNYFHKSVEIHDNTTKKKRKKRGRPNSTAGLYILRLHAYLERYTKLKKNKASSISNQQAGFIGKFLISIGILDKDISYEADNIRKILKGFNQRWEEVSNKIKNFNPLNPFG